MRTFKVELVGKTPLLMHADNIEWADRMEKWQKDPQASKGSKRGDDRYPAYRWLGSLYHDGKQLAIPSDNFMRCLMEGGTMVQVPGGRGGKTFKAQTQSGCMTADAYLPLLVNGKPVPIDPLLALEKVKDYDEHQAAVAGYGFGLYLKRAKIGQAKHVRVRPRFESWSASGTLNVWDEQLTLEAMRQILTFAGQYKGLGDWRPGGKTPGPYGMFEAKISG